MRAGVNMIELYERFRPDGVRGVGHGDERSGLWFGML
jgi:hypothetical protein